MDEPKPKTWKREIAALMLLIYFGLLISGVFYPAAHAAAESLKFQVFAFAGLAFGLDAFAKQIK